MRIFVGQIYIRVGINFPFSLHFQKWLGDELTKRVEASEAYRQTYSDDFDLVFRVSAKSDIKEPEVKGPTVFKREKNVEFTIFLPHEGVDGGKQDGLSWKVKLLLNSIVSVLNRLGIDSSQIVSDATTLLDHFSSTPAMITLK